MTVTRILSQSPFLVLLLVLSSAARGQTIRVSAGELDRIGSIVSFEAPAELEHGGYTLRTDGGEVTELQVDEFGRAWFVLAKLAAGESLVFRVEGRETGNADLEAEEAANGISLRSGGEELLFYHATPKPLPRTDIDSLYTRAGYLHPVNSPMGRTVTDDYPRNHIHHHGIWAAWTNTEFDGRTPDFWNMGSGTGTVVVDSVSKTWSGSVNGGLVAHHRYVDLSGDTPVDALLETWTVRDFGVLDSDRPYHVFDLVLLQQTAGSDPLVLPEYRYGGVGFRGAWEWNGPDNTEFLTSEGRDRGDGHATRARWCHIGGPVDRVMTGISVLDHPENFRAPQPMRIHPTEPFFNYAPSQAGDFSIQPGQPYEMRYRFLVYDGRPDPDELDRLWKDYADPPRVEILP